MADKVIYPYPETAVDLYMQVRNGDGYVWNTSEAAFEEYNASNWANYAVAFEEQGSSKVYAADFPALEEGLYSLVIFLQDGGAPAVGDAPVAGGDAQWNGTTFVVVGDLLTHGDAAWATVSAATIAGAVLATPANKVATDGSGYVTVNNAAAIATAVWGAGTRTLTSFGTLATTVAAAVWGYANRTLSAFAFTPEDPNTGAIRAVTEALATALEEDGGAYRLTAAALANSPGGDATAANQADILNAIAALAAYDPEAIAAAVLAAEHETGVTVGNTLSTVRAWARGTVVRTSAASADPGVFQFQDSAGSVLFTLTIPKNGSGRTAA